MTSDLSLGAGFAPVTERDWLDAVDAVLKGAPFDKRLVTRTASGIAIEPLYDRTNHPVDLTGVGAPGDAPYVRGARSDRRPGWDIRQRHDLGGDPAATNRQILDDLEQGATSILLRIRSRVTDDDIRAALDAVYLDMAAVALDAGPWATEVAPMLAARWDEQGIAAADRTGALRIDPLGSMARFGAGMPPHLDDSVRYLASPGVTTMAVDSTPYTDGGASAALEVALSLATGVEYLRWMTGAGISVDDAADQIEFTYAATADQFVTIAKLRAARRCWSRVIQASGGATGAQRQHAMTSAAMYTRRDPWVNLLRSTIAAFGAVVGGAEAVTVLPFDTALGEPAELGRRTARNISLLLDEESHVGQVIDPAGGAWFVESHTDALADAAWAEFQRIEAQGGMHASLAAGLIQTRVAEDWEAQQGRIATRRQAIIGVSEFPDLDEAALEREAMPEIGRYNIDPAIEPVPMRRPADEYEAMRDAAAAGDPDPIFVAALGSPAVHSARLGFARNFFAAGGIECVLAPEHENGFDEPTEVAPAYVLSGASAAVICSSDAMYEEQADDVAGALKAAGCNRVYLAGNPGDRRGAYERAGVDAFIHIGSNVLDELSALHDLLQLDRSAR